MSTALLVLGWLCGWLLLWRIPRLVASGPRTLAPARNTTVIIPARNEAHTIGLLLGDLARQSTPPGEVIVVDDHSSDDTAAVARAARHGSLAVRVVPAPSLPPGWTGKSWACATGTATAAGERLVFLDADVRLAPDALAAVISEHRQRGGLVSVQPHHTVERPYEWLSAVPNIVSAMGVGLGGQPPNAAPRAAFGPCLVTSTGTYRAVGGHERVRHEVVEDMALGQAYAQDGHPVTLLGGGELVGFRMYPQGPGTLIQGWTKNLASGAGRTSRLRALGAALWVTAALTSIDWLVSGVATTPWHLAIPAAFVLQFAHLSRQVGTFPPLAWPTYPLLVGAFVALFVWSAVATHLTHEVRWRGRRIPVGGPHRGTRVVT